MQPEVGGSAWCDASSLQPTAAQNNMAMNQNTRLGGMLTLRVEIHTAMTCVVIGHKVKHSLSSWAQKLTSWELLRLHAKKMFSHLHSLRRV